MDTKPRLSPKLLALNRFLDFPPPHRVKEIRERVGLPDSHLTGLRSLVVEPDAVPVFDWCGRKSQHWGRGVLPESRAQSLTLIGDEGSGKSALLQATAFDLAHRCGPVPYDSGQVAYPHQTKPVSVRYFTAIGLWNAIKGAFEEKKPDATELYAEIVETQVLVLDDLHLLPCQVWAQDEWASLMEVRASNQRPALYASGKPLEALALGLQKGRFGTGGLETAQHAFSRIRPRNQEVHIPPLPLVDGKPTNWHERPLQARTERSPFFLEWPDKREGQR